MTQHNPYRPTQVPTDLVLDSQVVYDGETGEPITLYWMAVIDNYAAGPNGEPLYPTRPFDGVVWTDNGSLFDHI